MDVENKDQGVERVISTEKTQSKAFKTAITSIMAALACVVTLSVNISTPATHGYFDIGDSIVYLSAVLFGPYIGAVSGGVGSMLSDLLSGYPQYAPGTLLIKGMEGFIVGYLYQRLSKINTENASGKNRKNYLIFLGIFIASGVLFFTLVQLNINKINYNGLNIPYLYTLSDKLGNPFWIFLDVVVVVIILIVVLIRVLKPTLSAKLISMLVGGCVMVLGYFLYEAFLLSYGAATALTEVPVNFLQVLVGILIAVPLSTPIKKSIRI